LAVRALAHFLPSGKEDDPARPRSAAGDQTIRNQSKRCLLGEQTRRKLIATLGLGALTIGCGPASARHRKDDPSDPAKRDTARTSLPSVGMASFYGREHNGSMTASGERFNMHELTAAHRSIAFGTRVKVTNLLNGKQVVVRINDRGPFTRGRVIDLSHGAAEVLDFVARGVTKVQIEPA
jgi:rare lipoprotein A